MALPLKVWTGTEWIEVGSNAGQVYYSANTPTYAGIGDIWVESDSDNSVLSPSNFLTISSASTTYATKTSPVFNGTANFSNASVIFNSASVSGLSSGGGATVNSNLLYNGAMQVHQRIAVSASANTINNYGDYMSADRWYSEVPYLQSFGTIAQSVENDAPTGSGFRKSLRHAYSGSDAISAGKYMWISQKLEGQDCQAIRKGTASAKSLTLSFWVKSNLTGTYIAELVDTDNTRYVSQSYTVSVANTWEFKTVTFPPDTTGVLNNDNGESLRLNFWLRGGSNFSGGGSLQTTWGTTANTRAVGQVNLAETVGNYWQITGVKLEVGTSATDYDFKPFQEDLRECQRYYYRETALSGNSYKGSGFAYSTTSTYIALDFPNVMRARPSALEQTGTAADYALVYDATAANCSSVPTYGDATTSSALIVATVPSGLTVGRGAVFRINTADKYLAWSAEL